MTGNFESTLNELTQQLDATKIPLNGVEFVGKGLKLDNANDAQPVIDAIKNLEGPLEFLNLEGNTIGVEAAKAIAKAFEDKPTLRHALWKDMFTSRLKTEIPPALKAFSNSLMLAGARLEVLDLSDNASGPIGVDGISELLSSEVCYGLKELRLANMGLGISGAEKLASALQKCYENAKAAGTVFALKVFIAGRNRLENPGCIALSKVFKQIGTLEEIQIYQNAIYHVGIEALSDALSRNPNLRVLNLNDNTITKKGAVHLTAALNKLPNLTSLNVGDCLLKSGGSVLIASALKDSLPRLEELTMTSNEISGSAGMVIAQSLINKKHLRTVQLGENSFGSKLDKIDQMIRSACCSNPGFSLSISDDEGSEDEEDVEGEDEVGDEEGTSEGEEENDEDYEEEEEEDDDDEEDDSEGYSGDDFTGDYSGISTLDTTSPMLRNYVQQKIDTKNAVNPFTKINPADSYDQVINKIEGLPVEIQVEKLLTEIMHQASKSIDKTSADDLGIKLYKKLFSVTESSSSLHLVNNLLPAYLGLIKFEKRKEPSMQFDNNSSVKLLHKAMSEGFFPKETADILKFLISRGGETNNN
ncbi:hypothetical protein GE061_004631 [Apolygus lucorum]|uniref:Ran-GTPase activating protein 1 C-terminal domain-containing protein n=1 Tax=Apolygus lucorum TaxID=248454 RepID=A0A6A4IXZ8_APOLU|nr:hypothetical protein GE061_004631 [Apolygus lucorum]